jgi:hypothetical protein
MHPICEDAAARDSIGVPGRTPQKKQATAMFEAQ